MAIMHTMMITAINRIAMKGVAVIASGTIGS
jgi:hypothetical protein